MGCERGDARGETQEARGKPQKAQKAQKGRGKRGEARGDIHGGTRREARANSDLPLTFLGDAPVLAQRYKAKQPHKRWERTIKARSLCSHNAIINR